MSQTIESEISQQIPYPLEKDVFLQTEIDDSDLSEIDICDSLGLYMKEVARHPLLTADEEKELKQKILKGDEDAWDKMFKANSRLVITEAYKFTNRGLEFLDLIQAGNIGCILAIDKFDPKKGKFSNFAIPSIRWQIIKTVQNESRVIRLPANIHNKIFKIFRLASILRNKLQREPTLEEIAIATNKNVKYVKKLLDLKRKPLSLEQSMGEHSSDDGEFDELGDLVKDPRVNVAEEAENDILQEQVKKLICTLEKDRDKLILELRFGFYDGSIYTLQKIGDFLGMSREGVRIIVKKFLEKLKPQAYQMGLKPGMENDIDNEDFKLIVPENNSRRPLRKDLIPIAEKLKSLLPKIKNPQYREIMGLKYGLLEGGYHTIKELSKRFGCSIANICVINKRVLVELGLKEAKNPKKEK